MALTGEQILENFLSKNYGLNGLGKWAWTSYLNSGVADIDAFIKGQLTVEIPEQPAFKARFPAYSELLNSGSPMTVEQIKSFESFAMAKASQYGVPDAMFRDPALIGKMLVAGVRENELEQRFSINRDAAVNAPPEVRQALSSMYGVSNVDGALTAYYFDPDRALPLLNQQFQAAQIAGAGIQQQVDVSQQTAERLAQQGVTWDQAQQGFRQVGLGRGLSAAGGDSVTQEQMVAAQFGDGAAQTSVERARAGRKAAFGGGGSPTEGQSGVSGLGSTSR